MTLLGVVIMFGENRGKSILLTPAMCDKFCKENVISPHSNNPLEAYAVYNQTNFEEIWEYAR